MRVRFTLPAAGQLDRVIAHIAQHSPNGARNVHQRILDVLLLLMQHPHIGQVTERPGIRRIVVTPYPYAITYRPTDDEIVVLGIRHAARTPLA